MNIMKIQLITTFIIITVPIIFVSCISSLLKDKAPTFSSEIKFTAPAQPFVKTETSVYPSWKNSKTGNVIAIVSDCNDISSNKLSTLHQLIEDSLDNVKSIKEETIALQNRPALLRVISAQLDGLQIEVQSISFKRKSCAYVASLSGKLNTLETDRPQFEKFINGFSFE